MRAFLAALALSLAVHAAEQTLTLKVGGWHSKGDAYKTEQALREVKGVKRASADAAAKQVTVVYDDAVASPAAIQKAISDAGYSASR
jgi:copper chaperone CopZ